MGTTCGLDWRLTAAASLIGAAAVAVGLHPQPFEWEVAVTRWVQQAGWLYAPLWAVSWPGNSVAVQGFMLMLVCGLLARGGRRREAETLAYVGVGAFLLNLLLKVWVARPRPTPDVVQLHVAAAGWSFPSGHVMFYTAFYGGVAAFARAKLPHGVKRTVVVALCGILVALVGPSRIFLGAHWLTDVLAGYGCGLAWLRLTGAALWRSSPASETVAASPARATDAARAITSPKRHSNV